MTERLRKQAHRHVLVDVVVQIRCGIAVAAAPVDRTVLQCDGIAQRAVKQVAAHLHTDVAVRHDVDGQSALCEADVVGALHALDAERHLEFAAGDIEVWLEVSDDVGVLHDRLAAAEIWREAVVKYLAERTLDDRPHAAKQKG